MDIFVSEFSGSWNRMPTDGGDRSHAGPSGKVVLGCGLRKGLSLPACQDSLVTGKNRQCGWGMCGVWGVGSGEISTQCKCIPNLHFIKVDSETSVHGCKGCAKGGMGTFVSDVAFWMDVQCDRRYLTCGVVSPSLRCAYAQFIHEFVLRVALGQNKDIFF